jgi:hypothetical protein
LLLATLLATTAAATGSAQSQTFDVPSYRPLQAAALMAAPGTPGADFSANAPSLASLTLLATIPAASGPRRGYVIQAQCAAGLTVALEDQSARSVPTLVVLAGAPQDGGQGGTLDMSGIPHTGSIKIYSSSATCQMAARVW